MLETLDPATASQSRLAHLFSLNSAMSNIHAVK